MSEYKDGINQVCCSFCGKSQSQVKRMVAGPGVYICDECVALCQEIIESENVSEPLEFDDLPVPLEIKKHLDSFVIAQDRAKKALAVAVYNHYKRISTQKSRMPGSASTVVSR